MSTLDGLIAIAVMAATTYLLRAAGYGMMARVPLTARVRRVLDALPGSIIAATVVPLVVKSGPSAALAIAAAAAIMLVCRNEFLAVAAAVLVAALVRHAGI
jgi:uncharacterized membrane protein